MNEDIREFGLSVECPPGTLLEGMVKDGFEISFESAKTEYFPKWEGKPKYIDGGVVAYPYLIRTDGGEVDEGIKEQWEVQISDGYDVDTDKVFIPGWKLPEGYATSHRYVQRWAWYIVVPKEFVK